jgi:RNA polymerase primary sigma factor
MAEAMDMPLSRYKRMIRLTRKSISLELPAYKQNPKDLGMEGDDSIADITSRTDYLGSMDEENVSPQKCVDRSLFHQDLREMLKILNNDERQVIRLRYGLQDGLTRTVTAVAAELKRTPAWVRSNESKALRKLRRPWYEKKLMEHQEALTG